jgi:hypothetical protein
MVSPAVNPTTELLRAWRKLRAASSSAQVFDRLERPTGSKSAHAVARAGARPLTSGKWAIASRNGRAVAGYHPSKEIAVHETPGLSRPRPTLGQVLPQGPKPQMSGAGTSKSACA